MRMRRVMQNDAKQAIVPQTLRTTAVVNLPSAQQDCKGDEIHVAPSRHTIAEDVYQETCATMTCATMTVLSDSKSLCLLF